MKLLVLFFSVVSIAIVAITASWGFVSSHVLPNTTLGLYSRDFFENILVEAHGMILDIFAISLILGWLEKTKEKKDVTNDLVERLNNLKHYTGQDAPYVTYGIIIKLMKMGIHSISAPESNLNSLQIKSVIFKQSNLRATNYSKTHLEHCEFEDCEAEASIFIDAVIEHTRFVKTNLSRSKFIDAKLNGCDFSTCDIRRTNFKNASLRSAIFRGVDCAGVNFEGADLRGCNFIGAKNLTTLMLSRAKDTKYIKT